MNHNLMGYEEHGFEMAINQFADMTTEEFSQRLGLRPISVDDNLETIPYTPKNAAPDAVDWRKDGAVTAVKD